jgi:hypothetical protein
MGNGDLSQLEVSIPEYGFPAGTDRYNTDALSDRIPLLYLGRRPLSKSVFDRWIDRYTTRVQIGDFLQRAAETGAAFLFAFGATVLAVKLLVPQAWPNILWGGMGILPAWGVAWWFARRQHRQRWQSVARLDSALGSGGLLMMLSEMPDNEMGNEEWGRSLPQLELAWKSALPRVRPKRFAGYLALPLLFAVGACFVPLREASTAVTLRNTVGQQAAQELADLLDSIEEEKILDEQEQKQLQEEIARLAEETRETPLTHEKWETVDALRERMKVRLESASMLTSQARDAATLLAESNHADPAAGQLSLDRTEQLEKDLTDTLQKLMKKGACSGASQSLQDQLQRLCKNGKLQMPGNAGERQELLDELQEFLDAENKKLSDLRKKCSECKACKAGECEGECEGGQCQSAGQCNSNRPGKGGVNRGRGDAELTWGDEADKQGAKFKEVVLPKGFLDQPKDEVLTVQKTAPTEEAAASAPRSAARDDEATAGQTTWNRKLNPRHRNAVRKYFDGK